MYILGLSSYAHEATCSLIKDGAIRIVLEQERLNREKHTWKFPKEAIEQCLDFEGITMDDVDHITFFWNPIAEIYSNLGHVIRYFPTSLKLLTSDSGAEGLTFLNRVKAMHGIGTAIQKQFSLVQKPKVEFIEHHMCHAASCFFVSEFKEAAILVLDGRGESASMTIAIGKDNHIQKIMDIKVPHSVGHLYACITDYLGFTPFYDEWKVMGLSAYGKDTYCKDFEDVVQLTADGGYRLNLKYFDFHTHGRSKWLSDFFIKKFGPKRAKNDPYDQRFLDISYALQRLVEKIGVHLANHLYAVTKSPNLCMAGGVILNCLMNEEIVKKTPFKNFFIQPLANDAGASLGAALYYYHQTLNKPRTYTFDSAYLGGEFTNEQIEKVLSGYKVRFHRSSNIAQETAKHIAQGKIVGWFQGRMEAGPRALGNRSIVVDPSDATMKDKLNSRVKKREFFRPFAPSVLEEKVAQYFDMPKQQPSPHMILTGKVKVDKKSVIPAVTHIDGTARVQTVSKKTNLRYWQLISEFERIKGIPVLLNTSFNENEPIVYTPKDAVECFLRTEFDVLAIGDFLVQKNYQ